MRELSENARLSRESLTRDAWDLACLESAEDGAVSCRLLWNRRIVGKTRSSLKTGLAWPGLINFVIG